MLFRIFLFRLFNKIETWKLLEGAFGEVSLVNFDRQKYAAVLDREKQSRPIYGNAFILCANKTFGYDKKHDNHLALIERVFIKGKIYQELINSKSLKLLFESLRKLPLIGDFMAYQIAVDFNYSEVFNFDENDFTVPGPGAIRGINKCFLDIGNQSREQIIQHMVEDQDKYFTQLGLSFRNLWGRPLHAIDCQGLFCEVDKYCRVKFPELKSNRSKIKTMYKPTDDKINYFFPPKWGINRKIGVQ